MVAIKETRNESSTTGRQTAMGIQDRSVMAQSERVSLLRSQLIENLGERLFKEVYDYMQYHKKKGTPEVKIQKHIKENYARGVYDSIFKIDQLVFMESMISNKTN